MPSPGMRGWYVELDEELVRRFDQLFPDHGAKARITEDAVIRAISNALVDDALSTPEGDNVSGKTGSSRSSNPGAAGTGTDGSRSGK